MNFKQLSFVGLVPFIFFIVSFLTLPDYGINWDEPIHFNRGQGYLYLFLTGRTEYAGPISARPSSFYGYEPKALFSWDGGHPPFSDILASFSNFVFYQKLGILGDISSYHLFNILASVLAVFVVGVFAFMVSGLFASIIATFTFAAYPLFFSEAHFNIKDPPETAFYTLAIFSFWMSLRKGSWKWLFLSSVSVGAALGTKFNIVFLPFILVPYLFVRYFSVIEKGPSKIVTSLKKVQRSYWLVLLLAPVVVAVLFFGSWPFLWQDPLKNLIGIVKYYKDIGTGFEYQPGEYIFGRFNLYPLFWIAVSSPPWMLFLASVGAVFALFKPDRQKATWLWLLWFLLPILRVSLPNMSIYGGIRQIMEFLPAMALLTGVGASFIYGRLIKIFARVGVKNHFLPVAILLGAFVPHIIVMVKLHPNQNVYFNSFVGGLSGAKERNIPSWGNSYGNAYWQGLGWINKNAKPRARLALIQGTGQNIGLAQLRSDIEFSNVSWSGINRKGEYLMELVYEGSRRAYPYAWDYVDKFLDPVYDVEADGVVIARVWKNDLEHTKPEMKKSEVIQKTKPAVWQNNVVGIDLDRKVELTRLVISYDEAVGCTKDGTVQISLDGKEWSSEPEPLAIEQVIAAHSFASEDINFYFPGREAQFVRIITSEDNSCYSHDSRVDIFALE